MIDCLIQLIVFVGVIKYMEYVVKIKNYKILVV